MNILDLLKEDMLLLPKTNTNALFTDFLKQMYKNFIQVVSQLDEGTLASELTSKIELLNAFCGKLIGSAEMYYSGYPAKAYFIFEEGMTLIDSLLFPSEKTIVVPKYNEPFFRARTGANVQFEKREMFHVPFEKREIVTTQRFSVPGLPCLYLSNSIYVCWEELRRPDINKMQVARMRLENYKIEFLDLSLTPQYLAKMLEVTVSEDYLKEMKKTKDEALNDWDKTTLTYLLCWPLVAACSVKVREPQGSFKPEYIFPQFLLQWVTQNKNIHGIKYFSVEAHMSSKVDHSKLINFALPVKTSCDKGLCPFLTDSFSLTEAVSWELLTMSNPEIIKYDHEKIKRVIHLLGTNNLLGQLELIKGNKVNYWRSIFGKMEIEMAEMDHEKI